jgi:hypothetical protein
MNNSDAVTLNPGVYILGNGGKKTGDAMTIRGTATLTGSGVMFYIAQGSVTVNGSGDIHLTPPPSGVYEGIQFFQARDNTSEAQFNGTGLVTGDGSSVDSPCGVFYFPVAHVQIGGNQNQEMYIDSIVANTIEVYGNGEIHITRGYDNEHGGDPVYLVE